jgi:Protein of unknown function (DUF1186)
MPNSSYAAPLDRLLTLGKAWGSQPWPDYLALGLGSEHVPDLIRMATDPELNEAVSESSAVWAPAHAWRALAQLHAADAAPALAQLFRRIDENHDDFVGEDLPKAFGILGPGAIPALMAYLTDDSHGLWARVAAGHSLGYIGIRHPLAREACVAVLAGQLGLFAQQDPALNGWLVAYLLDLKAVEAADVIEQAYRAGDVDEMVAGAWEHVQMALGLKDEMGKLIQVPGTPAAVYELADATHKPRPQPQPSPQSVMEARLVQALRETELEVDLGPKRKHHRKRK